MFQFRIVIPSERLCRNCSKAWVIKTIDQNFHDRHPRML
jgi:hypothetical protein